MQSTEYRVQSKEYRVPSTEPEEMAAKMIACNVPHDSRGRLTFSVKVILVLATSRDIRGCLSMNRGRHSFGHLSRH